MTASNKSFFETGNVKFEDNGSAKIRDISFGEENIDDPIMVTTSVTNSAIEVIPYIIDVPHLVEIMNQDNPMPPLI